MSIYLIGCAVAAFLSVLLLIVEWKEGVDKNLLQCLQILIFSALFSWLSTFFLGCALLHYFAMVLSGITIKGKKQ